MTSREGKSFLCEGLQKCGCATDIDELIVYKYGNLKEAVNYQHDLITGDIDFSKEKPTVRYVVKCFIHIGVYAAWPQEMCRGNGKCVAYKKDLVAMEHDQNCCYNETMLDKGKTMYWFRGEAGVERFIKEKLLRE